MIENNTQLAAALFQMESFADTLEGMRRHAQQTEDSVFATTAGGYVSALRERIAEAKAYADGLPDVPKIASGRNGAEGISAVGADKARSHHPSVITIA